MRQRNRDPDDESLELACLLEQHDRSALTYLYKYAPRLELSLRWKFDRLIDSEDLKDIVRDTLLRAFDTGERYDPYVAKPDTWLHTLAIYEALEFLRRRLDNQTLSSFLHTLAAELEAKRPTTMEDPSAQIEAVLQRLSPRRAMIIRMYYYQGYTLEDIAAELDIAEGSVRSNLSRARADMRRWINEGQ